MGIFVIFLMHNVFSTILDNFAPNLVRDHLPCHVILFFFEGCITLRTLGLLLVSPPHKMLLSYKLQTFFLPATLHVYGSLASYSGHVGWREKWPAYEANGWEVAFCSYFLM